MLQGSGGIVVNVQHETSSNQTNHHHRENIMNKKIAAISIAAGLSLGGAAGAVLSFPSVSGAQTSSDSTSTATATPAAARVALSDVIAGLVTDGTLTQAQADKVVAAVEAARPTGGRGGPGARGGRGMGLTAAATALGVTVEELRTAVQGGQTVAQVAASKGVDVQKVIDAMVADYTAKEQAEVVTGEHTQAEVDAKIAAFPARAAEIVNGTLPVGGPGRGHRGQSPAATTDTTSTTATGAAA